MNEAFCKIPDMRSDVGGRNSRVTFLSPVPRTTMNVLICMELLKKQVQASDESTPPPNATNRRL